MVAVDLSGEVIHKIRIRYNFSMTEDYYKKLGTLVKKMIVEGNLNRNRILGVGIGISGLISEDKQQVYYGKVLNFTGATRAEFSEFIPFPTELCHDADAAGFAEIWNEPEDSSYDAFYLMINDSVRGAVLMKNGTSQWDSVRNSEIAHTTLVIDGKNCYCGKKGCMHVYCAPEDLTGLAGGNLPDFFAMLQEGDPLIQKTWKEYLGYLAVSINNLRMLFNCDIIIGGSISNFMESYLEELRNLVAERNSFENKAEFLRICRYKDEPIAAGSALILY